MSDKIFSLLGPENIGCGRKLKPDQLVKLTDIRRSYEKTWRPFDAHLDHVLVDDRKYAYASSIDRIVCFTKDIDLYVSGIFGHIENDIICGHALPSTFSFSFSFTEDDIESSYHEAVVSKIFEYSFKNSLNIGKCHSYIDSISSVTGYTFGRCLGDVCLPSANGFVVATKRFGALKAIYLDHIGYEDEVGKCIATKTISQSHRSLLGDLVSSECVASDASGFGLDGALRTLADKFGVRIDLDQEKLLFCSEFSRSISVECLEFKNPFQNSSVNYSRPQPANSHLSEVSGPLIILVPIDKLDRFLQNCCSAGYADAHVIGAWSQK